MRIGPDSMASVFTGHITLPIAEGGRKAAFDIVGDGALRWWIIDVSGITGFDGDVRKAGFVWMKAFRAHGGERMFIVTTSGAVRMLGSALAFATRMPVSFVATRAAADEQIK